MPISKLFGLPIHTEEDFKEINGGAWEEKKPEEILRLYRNANALWLKDIRLARCTGGENMQEVQNRGTMGTYIFCQLLNIIPREMPVTLL